MGNNQINLPLFYGLLTYILLFYNNKTRNWELLAPWQGSKIKVATKFIVGDKDVGFDSLGTREYVLGDVFKSYVPNLEVVILEDGHHFIQQEKPQQVSNEILSFLSKYSTH